MDFPRPTSARRAPTAGFTLVEILMVLTPVAFISLGVITAYLFLGRNFTRLGNTQQQDVKARRALFYFSQDVGSAIAFTSTATANLTMTVPMSSVTVTGASLTFASRNVTCATTASLAVGMVLTCPGIPANTIVSSITNSAQFVMSANATATSSGVSIVAVGSGTTLAGCSITSGSPNVTCSSTTGLSAGMLLTATGIPVGSTISSITSGTVFAMNGNASATSAATSIVFTNSATTVSYAYDSSAGTLTRSGGSTLTLLTDIDSTASNPSNGFVYYNQSGTAVTAAGSVKSVEFAFTTKVGTANIGTQSSYRIVSPRVVARNKQYLP